MEVWQDYEAAAINWAVYVEEMDIPSGREFFGGKPALGGLDNRKEGVLYSGNEEEIRKAVRELIETCGKKAFCWAQTAPFQGICRRTCPLGAGRGKKHIGIWKKTL